MINIKKYKTCKHADECYYIDDDCGETHFICRICEELSSLQTEIKQLKEEIDLVKQSKTVIETIVNQPNATLDMSKYEGPIYIHTLQMLGGKLIYPESGKCKKIRETFKYERPRNNQ